MNEYQKIITRYLTRYTNLGNTLTDPVEKLKNQGVIEHYQDLFEKYERLEDVEHLFGGEDEEEEISGAVSNEREE